MVTAKLKKQHSLNEPIRYLQWKTGKLVRDLSNSEIQILLDEGTIKEKINIGAITNPGEIPKRANEIKAKGVEERQKIIDSQVDLITKILILRFKVKTRN
jgi:hypothetical protein